jgi:hypothetical protein
MLSKLKNFFSSKKEVKPVEPEPQKQVEVKPKKVRKKTVKPKEMQSATPPIADDNEPFIKILKVEIDPNNINNGAFELDWNDKFVLNLIRAGYKIREDDTDQMIVDRWFQTVCRNIALELYEQQVADPEKRNDIRIVSTRDIGNGRTEVS